MTQILARKKHGIPNGSRLVDVLIVITVAVIVALQKNKKQIENRTEK